MENVYLEKVAAMSNKDKSNAYTAASASSSAATIGGVAYGQSKRNALGTRLVGFAKKFNPHMNNAKTLDARANRASRFLGALDNVQSVDSKIVGKMKLGGKLGGVVAGSSALAAYAYNKKDAASIKKDTN